MTARVLKGPEVHVNQPVDQASSDAFQHALEEAFARGREIGAAEATRGLEDDVSSLRTAIAAATRELRSEVAQAVTQDAEAVARLASDLVAWYLDETAATEPEALVATMQASVAALADETALVLHVSPEIAEAIEADGGVGVDVVRADASLGGADFRLVADGTLIERRWGDAIEDVRADLIAAIRLGRRQPEVSGA